MTHHHAALHGVHRPRNLISIFARWLGTHAWLMRLEPVIIWAEAHLRAWTHNRVSLIDIAGLASAQITVPGRKSGIPRTTALLAVPVGEGCVVAGSNWGKSKHPVWSANLLDAQEAEVKLGRVSQPMSVRLLAGEERADMWKAIVHYWPGYEMELRISGRREFRVFLLEPIAATGADLDRGAENGRRSA